MNQDLINRMPAHLKSVIDSMSDELKNTLFPDEEINWEYINFIREKAIELALFKTPFTFSKKYIDDMLWTIQEFIDAIMQEQAFDSIYYSYDALSNSYTIFYVKTEESEDE